MASNTKDADKMDNMTVLASPVTKSLREGPSATFFFFSLGRLVMGLQLTARADHNTCDQTLSSELPITASLTQIFTNECYKVLQFSSVESE